MTKTALAAALTALVLPAAASAVDRPPAGTPANTTATERQNCLGPFRSGLAQTVGFDGEFNPGIHYGTVGEIQFLEENGLGDAC
jgi:hypothetical protein